MRLLIVEDEKQICDAIAKSLYDAGYEVDTCYDGEEALECILTENYDLVVLDLNLPGMDGMEILKELRQSNEETKVLILSARGQIADKVEGLDAGANDYMEKPFHLQELEARIRSLTRRKFVQKDVCLESGDIKFDTIKREAYAKEIKISLTRKEKGILEYLLLNLGRPVSQEELMEHVWDASVDSFSGAIRVHMSSLRRKLKAVLGHDVIMNKVGEGYKIREEGVDTRHNPEFTLMELYQAYTDYHGMMDLTENLYRHLAEKVCGSAKIEYNGIEMDLSKPFERLTMVDAVKKYAGVDWNEVETVEQARELAKEHHVEFEEHHKKGDILNLFFEEFVEEHLVQPTFIMDHPIEISPLTKKKPENPEYVERFEFFMNGWEMANAYSELNDPIDQRERFKAQEELLALGDEEANTTDEDFMNALEIGMPPTGGIGFGIDRMCMLLTNAAAIRDVLLFPTMKTLNDVNKKNDVKSKAAEEVKAEPEKIDFSKVKIEPLFEEAVDFDTFSKSDFRAVKVKECVAVPKSKKLLQFTLDDGTGTDRTILSGIHAYYEPEELVGKTLIAITNLPPRAMMGIDSCGMLLSAIHEEEGEEKLHLLMVDDHIPAGAKLY